MSKTISTSVVIIGGGPVGLAMGLLLHRHQIDCVVIEQILGTTDNPKSRGCWIRTMELFRQCGIEEEKIRARGLPGGSAVQTGSSINDAGAASRGNGSGHPDRPTWRCSGASGRAWGSAHTVAGRRPNLGTIESLYERVGSGLARPSRTAGQSKLPSDSNLPFHHWASTIKVGAHVARSIAQCELSSISGSKLRRRLPSR
jgi:hypothetical protein